MNDPVDRGRRAELAANLATVRERIRAAAVAAGRNPEEVTLVVVTKFFPASDVRLLYDLGVRDVGENRHQEAADKALACADLDLTWHFIGNLQSNKAPAVAGYADVVQSVDRAKLLPGLSRGAAGRGRTVAVLVQVSLDEDPVAGRGGIRPELAAALADLAAGTGGLSLKGVMGVAPPDGSAVDAFARLAEVAAEVRAKHPGATWLSAGMSDDLEDAVAAGATHVRVGRGVLGNRPLRR